MASVSSLGNTFVQPGRATTRYDPNEMNKFHQGMADRARKLIGKHELAEKEQDKKLRDEEKDVPPEDRPLKVSHIEFYVNDNSVKHHTQKYELLKSDQQCLIVRRGQNMFLTIRFHPRPFDPQQDWVKFVFLFGPTPNVARGSKVELLLMPKENFSKPEGMWDVRIANRNNRDLVLELRLPPTLYVGLWKCHVVSRLKSFKEREQKFECPCDIYVLFNPWCKEDTVYIEDEKWRNECVLNDEGKIYMGTYRCPQGRVWLYSQFDDVILPACLYLLDCAKLDFTARGDPIRVVRAVSAIINSRDDNGLLVDNWSGDYAGGTSPMDWTGSSKIFEEYMKTGGQPVKYGQCWVFAACSTTFCRALGIPCRTVSNYVSAHDCHHNLTVDKFHDCNGDLKDDVEQDTIWNFHVWNEVWMARPDLPKGYGGWQVIDATPQEQSEDVYQMGPASIEAVRRGEVGLQYDTMFVVSEVNADIIHWQDDEESEIGMRKMKTFNYYIGKKILTKSTDKFDDSGIKDSENITSLYKNPEGSAEERMQVLNAARNARLWYLYDTPRVGAEDVDFDLIDIDSIHLGQPFNITVEVKNKSNVRRTVFIVLSADTVYYTGVRHSHLKKEKQKFILNPNQNEVLAIQVRGHEYVNKLTDYSMIKIYATASVEETRQTWAEEDDVTVMKPSLNLELRGTPQVNHEFGIACSFVNPLETMLENCHFLFEGHGVIRSKVVSFRNVQAGESIHHEEKFLPLQAGNKKVVVTFGSGTLSEIYGSISVNIKDA